jgi:hypothetical protein
VIVMREVIEQEPEPPARGRRALLVLAGLGVAAVVVTRLVAMQDEPVADLPPAPPPTQEPGPLRPAAPDFWGEPISQAPVMVRMIGLVAATRSAFLTGSLGGDLGKSLVTPGTPYPTDSVVVYEYGAGVVVGPAPGTPTAGPVQVLGLDVPAPDELVDGIVPAVGGGYWFVDTARTPSGACQMHLVMLSGQRSERSVTYPCAFVPQRETAAGFAGRVGSRLDPTSGMLLDEATGELRPMGGAVLGAADRYVVRWTWDLSDPLLVQDMVSGDVVDVELPPGRATRQVSLSADGNFLAVVLTEQLVGVRSYEVWVHDLVHGGARMATVTTLDENPLELAWRGQVLVVVGNGVEAYDAAAGKLYRSPLRPVPGQLDAVAMSFAVL